MLFFFNDTATTEIYTLSLHDALPILGTLSEYVVGRVQRTVRPDRITKAHADLEALARPITDQVQRLRSTAEAQLRRHGRRIVDQGMVHKRLSDALSDVYAQIAVISRRSEE